MPPLPELVAREWLERVRGQLGDYPVEVQGPPPNRDPVAVAHMHQDVRGTSYATLNGFIENKGHLEAIELELAPGVVVPLAKAQIYYDEK